MSSASAEIKAALKEAREALKNKNFDVARSHCKVSNLGTKSSLKILTNLIKCIFNPVYATQIVLEQDPDHFMGLVLMGASLQESDPQMVRYFEYFSWAIVNTPSINGHAGGHTSTSSGKDSKQQSSRGAPRSFVVRRPK